MSSELEELIGGTVLPTVDDDGSVSPAPATATNNAPVEPTVVPAETGTQAETEELSEVAEAEPETATPEKALESEPHMVPLPVVMDLKHEIRDLRRELASLRAPAAAAAAPVAQEPDPIDVYAKEHAEALGLEPDEVPIPAKVFKQHQAWQERRQTAQTQQTAAQARQTALESARRTYTDEVLGEGLGFDTVVNQGFDLLTPGDKLDIENAGAACDKELYRRCVARLTGSGTPEGKLLAQRLAARLKGTEPSPPPSAPGTPRQPVVQARQVPTRQQVLGRHPGLEQFGFDGGAGNE